MKQLLPPRDSYRSYLLDCGKRYWPKQYDPLLALSIPEAPATNLYPLEYADVQLPEWAASLGIHEALLVPKHCIVQYAVSPEIQYKQVDWWQTAFLTLSCRDEWMWEEINGPLHSFSYKLNGNNHRNWDYAWINRIFLFLRRWAAREQQQCENTLFGPLPETEIIVTHDVETTSKTFPIRAKALAFDTFNGLSALWKRDIGLSISQLSSGIRFFLSSGNYMCFKEICQLERESGVRGRFFVYGGKGGIHRSPVQLLLDPAYSLTHHTELQSILRDLIRNGYSVGLHQSFSSWGQNENMIEEKNCLEQALGTPVTTCRQHWLRFSWQKTWHAQSEAGLQEDYTLGFNDRLGFRNGAALRIHPWDFSSGHKHRILSIPLILMDLQLYKYLNLSEESRYNTIARWIHEVHAVRGVASVLWHVHVLSPDWNYGPGFRQLLDILRKIRDSS